MTPTGREAFADSYDETLPINYSCDEGAERTGAAAENIYISAPLKDGLQDPHDDELQSNPRPISVGRGALNSAEDDVVRVPDLHVVMKKLPAKARRDLSRGVRFYQVRTRFYGYTIGASCPGSGGPSLGLDWDWQTHGGEIVVPVHDYEEFRGGNTPEEDEESEEEEEWDDNWRLPREYFQDEGLVDKGKRISLLGQAGHRRSSIDLSSYQSTFLLASRPKHSRSIVSKCIVEGFDAQEIFQFGQGGGRQQHGSAPGRSRWLPPSANGPKKKKNGARGLAAVGSETAGNQGNPQKGGEK
eukprot:FR743132.1.p1 GENE.FR743132.1~~FR743132.1.p1  ORF type:complete len:346 (+),score=54.28 FR743132.1:144-1040(+)